MNDYLIINGTSLRPDGPVAAAASGDVGVNEVLELQAIEAESIGWWPLGEDAYFHAIDRPGVVVVNVVGVPQEAQEGMPSLLLV